MVIREQYLKYLERITGLTAGGFVGILGQAATNSEQAFILGVAGVAVSKTLEKLTNEVSKRALGPQEEFRTGWVLYMVSQEVQRGIDEGKVVRNDGFFTQKSSGASSDAVEVIESIVLRCQREAVEKKIPYFASLFASIAFDVSISAELAHQIISTADQLSYRQLCILKLSATKKYTGLRDRPYHNEISFDRELYQILYECMDLYSKGLVNFNDEAALNFTYVHPKQMSVHALGGDIFWMMSLINIPDEDLEPIVKQLSM